MTNNPPATPAEVIGLANIQLEKAAKSYMLSRRAQILTFALGLTSIFLKNVYAYIPALLALASQAYAWVIRNQAARCHGIGEEGRTRGLLIDALGWAGERVELANWFSHANPRTGATGAPAKVPPDYFASQAQTGLRRLCDHLQENAFWGKHLYKAAAGLYARFLWAFAILTIATVLISVPLATEERGLILARVLVAVLASGAAVTQLGEVMAWKSAAAKSDALDRRLEILATVSERDLRSRHVGTVFSVYGDYCIATAVAPPVPKSIYSRDRDRLNELRQRLFS